jgi:hypothetical protein
MEIVLSIAVRINKKVRAAFLFLLFNTSRSNRIPKMLSNSLVALSLLSSAVSAETVLGVYMFHRHGDRTPKALAPANLTDLGYSQVFTSGDYYRSRYVDSEAEHKILGMNPDIVKQSQIAASSPADTGTFEYLRGRNRIEAVSLTHSHSPPKLRYWILARPLSCCWQRIGYSDSQKWIQCD